MAAGRRFWAGLPRSSALQRLSRRTRLRGSPSVQPEKLVRRSRPVPARSTPPTNFTTFLLAPHPRQVRVAIERHAARSTETRSGTSTGRRIGMRQTSASETPLPATLAANPEEIRSPTARRWGSACCTAAFACRKGTKSSRPRTTSTRRTEAWAPRGTNRRASAQGLAVPKRAQGFRRRDRLRYPGCSDVTHARGGADLGPLQHRCQAAHPCDRRCPAIEARAAVRRRGARPRYRGPQRHASSVATSSSPAATSGCSGHAARGSSGDGPRRGTKRTPTIPTFDGRAFGPWMQGRA